MNCEFNIDTSNQFITVTYLGKIDRLALQKCISELFSNPKFNNNYDGISDFRLAYLDMNYEELRLFKKWLDKQKNSSIGRWAVLVSTDLGYGTIRIWEVLSEGYHESLRVFKEEDEALRWLKEKSLTT